MKVMFLVNYISNIDIEKKISNYYDIKNDAGTLKISLSIKYMSKVFEASQRR